MFLRSYFLVVVLVLLCSSFVSPWRRRRRRRPPPPPVNCQVSAWSSWSDCSEKCKIGTWSRYRTIVRPPAYGGSSCPSLNDVGECGEFNGGCDDVCRSDGTCTCTKQGYELQDDKKSCGDIDECSDGGSATCVNSNCKNTDGSYECECFSGYKSSSIPRHCERKLCIRLPTKQCPADTYHDEFGTTCMPASINCPNGRKYQDSCSLTCPDNYKLSVIASSKVGEKFAQSFSTVDFNSPNEKTVCVVDTTSGNVKWDWDPNTTPYYCRRINDPPLNINISKTTMHEKEALLTPVGKLSATDPQKGHLTYSIVNQEGSINFLIQGNVLLVKSFIVWSPSMNNTYSVVVNVSDNGSPMMHSTSTFHINVLNINDQPYDLEISNNEIFENAPINSIVGNLTAVDDDVIPRRNSNFSWELVNSDNGFFSLLGNQIRVAKSLDHESKDVHRIQVRCTDYGIPRKTSQVVSMFVSVRDSNDSPKDINLTNHRVSENSPVGMVVGEIIAKDDDNDTLLFSLNETESKVLMKFALKDSAKCRSSIQDGKAIQTCTLPLIVNGSLDYEEENEYIIWLTVKDPGGTTRKRFTIEVLNVNEMPTDILLSDNRVPENSPGQTIIGEFLVKDPDNKNSFTESHTCSLMNSISGDEDSFYISLTSQRNLLRVKSNKVVDFEKKKLYNITVSCKDAKLSISKPFLIEITDVNEAPTSLHLSNTSVDETRSSITYIATLSTEDPEGLNQTFMYTVIDPLSFRIGGVNHDELYHVGPIDYERTPSIRVHLRVTDHGGLHFEKIFTITVEDKNDAPTDIRLHPNSALLENDVENIFISQVNMIDEDKNTRTSCQLLNTSNDRIQLKTLTTLLVGSTSTDYESLDSSKTLQILIKCQDQHGASVTRWISLPVQDVNEPPTNLNLSNLQVRENMNDTLVGILEISDPDEGQKHDCKIPDSSGFYIDTSVNPQTLRTAKPLDFESSSVEYVNIRCNDIVPGHHQRQFHIERLFKINVIDVNEVPQILCNIPFHVSSSFTRGSIIGQIQNYDPDNEDYHLSKKQNPKGPFKKRKQLLNYRFENENISWPFHLTLNGIMYLQKKLNPHEYNESIVFGIRVDDDGAVLERKAGSDEYEINYQQSKHSSQNCSMIISVNQTTTINLSSNEISENATNGTIIGFFSRTPILQHEQVTFHIIEEENETQPLEVHNDTLKLKFNNTLDYEALPAGKSFPVTISSVASVSGVFTQQFLIQVLDVNELPTAMCLTRSPRPDDCSVIGRILIEDLDYPELKCGSEDESISLERFSSQLSEYTCHIQEVLSNEVNVEKYFYIRDSIPTLYVNKTIFTLGDKPYAITVVCQSKKHATHIFSRRLDVNIKVPKTTSCRYDKPCSLCPQPTFCLTNIQAAGKCVEEQYRINSTVGIPVTVFNEPGFITVFENHVTSLIEGTADGKTLTQLVEEFNDANDKGSRRRREVSQYNTDDVYVEQFVYSGQGTTSTNVIFAVAEKPRYKLIPASHACKLLQNTDVKCFVDDGNSSADTGDGSDDSGFPFWIIILIVVVVVVVLIIAIVILRRRRRDKRDDTAVVQFARSSNTATVNSMYETPVDERDQRSLSPSGMSNPVLIEKRQDIKVFHNPTYRSQPSIKDSDMSEEEETNKRTMNDYEMTDPTPVYESIDDDLYEKVNEEKLKENDTTDVKPEKKTRKKSRSNPVYDVGVDDDSLNPVVNLAVTSPSRKIKKDGDGFSPIHEEDDSDDSLSAQIMSTFQSEPKHSYENVGVVNPLASQTDDDDDTQVKKEDSKPPISIKNDLYPLEHQTSFEGTSEGTSDDNQSIPPISPPPVYDNNELYSFEQQTNQSDNTDQSTC